MIDEKVIEKWCSEKSWLDIQFNTMTSIEAMRSADDALALLCTLSEELGYKPKTQLRGMEAVWEEFPSVFKAAVAADRAGQGREALALHRLAKLWSETLWSFEDRGKRSIGPVPVQRGRKLSERLQRRVTRWVDSVVVPLIVTWRRVFARIHGPRSR